MEYFATMWTNIVVLSLASRNKNLPLAVQNYVKADNQNYVKADYQNYVKADYQNYVKADYQTFQALSNFALILYVIPNIPHKIVGKYLTNNSFDCR